MKKDLKNLQQYLVKTIKDILDERGFGSLMNEKEIYKRLKDKTGRDTLKKILKTYKSPYYKFKTTYNFDNILVLIDLAFEKVGGKNEK